MILAYKNSEGKLQDIAIVKNEKEAIKKIEEYCANNNYDIPYINVSSHPDKIIYDIGSYTQFFYLYPENE